MIRNSLLLLASLSVLIGVAEAQSQGAQGADPLSQPLSRWRLGVALGYGFRENPLIQSDDVPILVDIDVAWFGDRVFFDNGDLGLTVTNNDALTLDLVARINSERVFFGRTNTRFITLDASGTTLDTPVLLDVPDRDFAIELGVEMLTDGDWGRLEVGAYRDVSATHGGYEIYGDYGYGWRQGRWYLDSAVGFSYKSQALNDYYWGVTEGETLASQGLLPAYDAGSGVNVSARLSVSYFFNQHWSFAMASEYERMNDHAASSPLVAQRHIVGYFTGLSYRF
ncbi:MAG: MipA/OmpV family protein [Pseudomonadota bacterium]